MSLSGKLEAGIGPEEVAFLTCLLIVIYYVLKSRIRFVTILNRIAHTASNRGAHGGPGVQKTPPALRQNNISARKFFRASDRENFIATILRCLYTCVLHILWFFVSLGTMNNLSCATACGLKMHKFVTKTICGWHTEHLQMASYK